MKYTAANGTVISNRGEKDIRGYTVSGEPNAMTMQVAGVTKPLGSVRAMTDANKRVVFDKGASYMLDQRTGVRAKIEERGPGVVW